MAQKLKRIQKQAGKAISGGYLRVAGEAYNIELELLPIDLYVKLAATRSALRLLTTPTIRGSERTSDSPLGKLSAKIEQQIGASISNLEVRKPYLCAPWKTLPLSFIAQNDTHAIIEHEKLLADTPALNFYTDGSGIDENIGAAAVNLDIGAVRRRYVSKIPDFTGYSGELVGVILALELAIDLKGNYPNLPIRIFADNQSAIRTARSSHTNVCQFLFDEVLRLHQQLERPLNIHWIPAHIGIPGNETADAEAKSAAKAVPLVRPAPTFPFITTPVLANFKKSLLKQWDQRWASHHHGRHLYRLQPTRDRNPLAKYNGLKKAVFSLIIQMRTGKQSINQSINQSSNRGLETSLFLLERPFSSCREDFMELLLRLFSSC